MLYHVWEGERRGEGNPRCVSPGGLNSSPTMCAMRESPLRRVGIIGKRGFERRIMSDFVAPGAVFGQRRVEPVSRRIFRKSLHSRGWLW